MCGITGVVDFGGRRMHPSHIDVMASRLRHRGPDRQRSLCLDQAGRPTVYLGHTRLRIIDLSEAADQPLPNEDGTVYVVFNGEIYNYLELKERLVGRGHRFRSLSDTEVIVHAYEEYGDAFVTHLDGMFAFALWDSTKRRLVLARDRCGKKPLYYSYGDQRLTFGSEIKALAPCDWIERSIDATTVAEYLAYGYIAAPRTMFSGIAQVPAGSYLTLDDNGLSGPHRYWDAVFSGERNDVTIREAATHVRALVTDAVGRRLVGDVPLGAFLSGGVDSSVVVYCMSKLMDQPIKTFTIGFSEDASYDERAQARLVARAYGTDHSEQEIDIGATELVEDLLEQHDQPYGDSSAIPTFLVSRMAKSDVTVALTGDGGDEIFAGYDRFLAAVLADRIPRALNRAGRRTSRFVPTAGSYFSIGRRLQRFFEDADAPIEERFRRWVSYFSDPDLAKLLREDFRVDISGIHRVFRTLLGETQGHDLLHRLLYLNFRTYLPEDLLVKVDRMSMANSLEIRSPLLDTRLIEYVAALPPSMKIRRGRLKFLLKKAFADAIPKEILTRPKHGFGVPLSRWFRAELGNMFADLFVVSEPRSGEFLDTSNVRTIFHEHANGRAEHGYRLWALLNLELWLRKQHERSVGDSACDVLPTAYP